MSEFDLTYLSLGCGLQSSALYVGCVLGLPGFPKCDAAIFADTRAEPRWVYDQLDFLRGWGGDRLRIDVVSKGDIAQDCIDRHAGRRTRFASIPVYVLGQDGRAAPMHRQCTGEYKIDEIERHVRKMLGYEPRQRIKKRVAAVIGISLDEVTRQKPARTPWMTNLHPLIDLGLSRVGCAALLVRYGVPVPKKSACVFCPYHDDTYWMDLKTNHPAEWDRAVGFDAAFRDMTKSGIANLVFLHRSLTPLPLVELKPKPAKEVRTLWDDQFINECEGLCGV